MKYLKTYQLFESSENDEVEQYLKDIFLELEDEGFDVDIEGRSDEPSDYERWLRTYDTEEHTGYEVKIKRNKTFLLEDVYELILTCKSYLKETGFFITEIAGNIPRNDRQERYGLDYGIGLHESDPEKFKLFDKPLIRLEFKIRKEK
jgi:hypothetical protein